MTTASVFVLPHATTMITRLQRILTWFIIAAIFIGSLEGGLFLFTQSPVFAVLTVMSYTGGGMAAGAHWLIQHQRITAALGFFWFIMVLIMVVTTILLPTFWPVTTLGAILAATVVLPYLSTSGVRWLLRGTWFVGVLIVVLGYAAPLTLSVPAELLTFTLLGSSLVVLTFLVSLLGQFSQQLLETTLRTQEANTALETARSQLETQVADRTAHLQEALTTIKDREAQLHATIADLQASQTTIRELSAPIIPVAARVLVAPLIGAIDSTRAMTFTETVLTAVEQQRARIVILDITGVPVIDTQVAKVLIETADAVGLLGTQVILVGIRPEVAQTMVGLGIELHNLQTYRDLEQALTLTTTNHIIQHRS